MAELMQAGNYKGKLINAELGEASTGTPQMVLTFDVGGVRRMVFLYLTDNTLGHESDGKPRISQRSLDTLGYNGDAPPTFGADTDNVELYMKHGAKEDGTPREEWNISGTFEVKPLSKDRTNRFLAEWRARSGGKSATKPPASKPTTTPPPSSSAPPPSSPPPSGDKDITSFEASTKEEAWAIWEREAENGSPNVPKWHAAIKDVGGGKIESKFTAADWKRVATAAVPF